MSLINCPECDNEILDKVKTCPHCGYSFKKRLKKLQLIIIVFVIVVVLGGIATFVILNVNNNVKNARNCYKSENLDGFIKIKAQMSTEEKIEFAEYLEKQVELIFNDYFNNTITYVEVTEKMNHLIQYSQSSLVSNYETTLNKIEILNDSHISYDNAINNENNGNYEQAIALYAKVNVNDSNYSNANEKIEALKLKLVETYRTEAEENAQKEEYENALAQINKALEYDSTNQELLSSKEDYTKKKEAQDKLKEENARKKALLHKGKTIETIAIKATFETANITDKIVPNNTNGYYLYYSPLDDSKVYLDIVFRVKNISSHTIYLENLVASVKALYDNQYTYTSYNCFYSDSSHINTVYSWDALDALEETTFHLAITLPKEVGETLVPLEVEFYLDAEKQILTYR
ncbi:zinc ribbon domain-containing protein [Anaerosporobacter sp.]|uniref:zinc ribbon domain-containing protein n=1 Tax=Anaerosporobacter sp. TaxID=1872529 RepID=UPI00286EDAE5|nr:zinc ribbon domain-containing protein [Anaerosporobacter sp.]